MNIGAFFRRATTKIGNGLVLKNGLYTEKGTTMQNDLVVKTGDVIFNDIPEVQQQPPLMTSPMPGQPIMITTTPTEMEGLDPGTVVAVPLIDNKSAILLIKLPLDDGSSIESPF